MVLPLAWLTEAEFRMVLPLVRLLPVKAELDDGVVGPTRKRTSVGTLPQEPSLGTAVRERADDDWLPPLNQLEPGRVDGTALDSCDVAAPEQLMLSSGTVIRLDGRDTGAPAQLMLSSGTIVPNPLHCRPDIRLRASLRALPAWLGGGITRDWVIWLAARLAAGFLL